MTDSSNKSGIYERTPVSLVMQGIPLPVDALLSTQKRVDFMHLAVRGFTTATTSVNHAARVTDRLVAKYLKRVRHGKITAVRDLLDINPMFIEVPKVGEAWVRLMGTKRAKRRRGRPGGIYTINPAIVLGFVMALRESKRVKTDHQAILKLVRWGILTYDQARNLHRAAKKDPALLPLLVPDRDKWQRLSSEESAEFEKELAKAITAQPGQSLSYAFGDDGVARLVEVTDAEPNGKAK